MSRIGQCPACRAIYELEEDAIGQVFECECEATLFAADISGFSEIPVFCSQCDGHYVVDSDGAGEEVECECGETIKVPDIVLRQPVSGPATAAGDNSDQATGSGSQEGTKLQLGQRLVNCPDCSNEYVITNADLGVEAECSCGCVFTAKIQSKKIVTVKVTEPKPARQSKRSAKSADDQDGEEKTPSRRERKRSPLTLVGIGLVGLLLLFSITMFGLRQAGLLSQGNSKPAVKPKPPLPVPISMAPVEPSENASDETPASTATKPSDSGDPDPINPDPINPDPINPDPIDPDPIDPDPINPDPINMVPRATAPLAVRTSPIQPNKSSTPASAGPPVPSSFAPPPPKELPEANPRRPLIPVIPGKTQGLTFDRVYKQAFESFNEMKELKDKPDSKKAFEESLGKTIGLLQNALRQIRGDKDNANLHQIRYLLTYCYYNAGRLPEAIVMAKAVARWGKAKEPATKEAAMIGLAASQEANQTHWGVPSETGELDQMKQLVDLIAKKWPNDPNLDLMRLSLAQSYDRFNVPRKAAGVYRQISDDSAHVVTARLATGAALWTEYRRMVAETDQPTPNQIKTRETILRTAKKAFSDAVTKITKADDAPNKKALTAKLTLARIALSQNKLSEAEDWLVGKPMSLKDSIAVKDEAGTIKFSSAFVRLVYETLFSIRAQQNNMPGATKALNELATKLGEGGDIGKMYLSASTSYIDQLSQSNQVNQEQFSNLVELIQPLQSDHKTLTSSNILWLGEAWSRLSGRAANDELARQCNEKAAAAYELAMSRPDFPKASRQAGLVRRSQLLRAAGQLDAAVVSLGDVLKQTPNAIELQIEAAASIQQSALDSHQPLSLTNAIKGPKDSPIWGWEKLVTTIYAASGDDEEKNAQRLSQCQYQLAFCKWQIAKATSDTGQRAARMSEATKLVSRLEATMKRDSQPWYDKFTALAKEVKAAQ